MSRLYMSPSYGHMTIKDDTSSAFRWCIILCPFLKAQQMAFFDTSWAFVIEAMQYVQCLAQKKQTPFQNSKSKKTPVMTVCGSKTIIVSAVYFSGFIWRNQTWTRNWFIKYVRVMHFSNIKKASLSRKSDETFFKCLKSWQGEHEATVMFFWYVAVDCRFNEQRVPSIDH